MVKSLTFAPMLLIKNIGKIVRAIPSEDYKESYQELPCMDNAWILIEGELIHSMGTMDEGIPSAEEMIDAAGGYVFPSWCDSHTHLVFAGSRELEFEDRIRGLSYQEIAMKGGGILNSAKRLQQTSFDDLLAQAKVRLNDVAKMGTGLIEMKSGYGLTTEAELKILRVIKELKKTSLVEIKSTFLGAHAIPLEYKENRVAYIKLIIEDMLPKIAEENLADYIDVFCEKVAFTVEETTAIIKAGKKYGLKAKIHTNQFYSLGGIELAIENDALSVDHLEVMTDEEVKLLANSNVIPTLLPSAPFFLNDEYPPARKMIDAGLKPALATDYNPGSSPSGNMNLAISLACVKMRMLPAEAINAATLYGAKALEMDDKFGSIKVGGMASLFITQPIPSIAFMPYSFGHHQVKEVVLKGKKIQ